MQLNRRKFLATAAGATATLALSRENVFAKANPAGSAESFDFVFFTDTHIQPELDAAQGCDKCFKQIAGVKSDFAIMGGDHVFDAGSVDGARAKLVFDLYQKSEQSLKMKLYQTIGNHDLFGIDAASKVSLSDPLYSKKLYEDRFGRKTYYSFDHRGYHFIVLDSIQTTPDRMWQGGIDEAQLTWLAEDLKKTGTRTPVIGITHVPLVTAFASYDPEVQTVEKYNTLTVSNSVPVLKILENYNVLAVLQGHLHVNEQVTYKNVQYITGGAVCGNWWRGLRMGVPEGFTVVSLHNGRISTRYETYGFNAVAGPEK